MAKERRQPSRHELMRKETEMRSPEQIGAEEQPIGGGIGRSGWATTRFWML